MPLSPLRRYRLADIREALALYLFKSARDKALTRIGLTEKDTPHVTWDTTDQAEWLADADALLASDAIEAVRSVQREADADLADRWLSHAGNFDSTFAEGSFFIHRNQAANKVPAAILNKMAPPLEPERR